MRKVYMNRELSWLKFNERVLEEAENKKVPLCERLNFAAIYQSNLDEFFMVRVGSLVDQMLLKKDIRDNKTNLTPEEQIKKILAEVGKLNRRRNVVYDEIMEELEEYDICITDFKKMNEKESEYVKRYFQGEIAPIIFPTIVAKRQPFPFLRNKEIYAVVVLETKSGKEKLGIIPCSSGMFKRLIELPGKRGTYILAEEVILHYMPEIFKGYIASADYMTRNTLRRVEVAAPVCNPAIKERLLEMFRIMLNDNQKARHEDSEGNYRIPMTIERPVDAQETFYQQAYEAATSKNV